MMWVQNVLFVSRFRYSVILVSMIKKKGFEVLFQDGKARLKLIVSSFSSIVIGLREHALYRLTDKPIDYKKKLEDQVQVP